MKITKKAKQLSNIWKIILFTVIAVCLGLLLTIIINWDSIRMKMAEFLIVNETPKKADVIIVLSGDFGERVAYGAKLYLAGYANKLLLSGHQSGLKEQALAAGVPENDIIVEYRSLTTFQNGKYSLKIVKEQGFKSVIVVTSPYHTRRSGIIFRQLFKGIDVTICSVPYDQQMTRTWQDNIESRQFVISEYLKLVFHYLFEWG